jgi:hypothetical protein
VNHVAANIKNDVLNVNKSFMRFILAFGDGCSEATILMKLIFIKFLPFITRALLMNGSWYEILLASHPIPPHGYSS